MHQIMTIYGTRPEAIKMAPLIQALDNHPGLNPVVAVTGQHREMLDQVNDLFGIVPEHDFDLMMPGASLEQLSSRALAATSDLLRTERPDAVVVQGDTSSAFVAALAAFYQKIPVIHLEAGLRTGDMSNPFPEEGNRRLISPLTAIHLAPTAESKGNLTREGTKEAQICVTGNTVIDALKQAIQRPVQFSDPAVGHAVNERRRILVVTTHRRESWGSRMQQAIDAIATLADSHPDVLVVLPMHRNQIVREVIEPSLRHLKNVLLTEPMSYHEFTHLLNAAEVILTDSGGVQEEAPSLGIPVLVMRDTTERPEAVTAGTVRLVGTDRARIIHECSTLLNDCAAYAKMANAVNPYGDGQAAARAVAAIAHYFGEGERLPDFQPS